MYRTYEKVACTSAYHIVDAYRTNSCGTKATMMTTGPRLCSGGFDPLTSNLSPVQANQPRLFHSVQVFTPLNLLIANGQNHLDVAWVSLIGINAPVGPIRPPTSFLTENRKSVNSNRRPIETQSTYRSLLNDNILDVQLLGVETLRVSICLGILQQSKNEFDRFLGPSA